MADGQVVENNSAVAVAEPAASGQSVQASSGTLENQNGQATSQDKSAPVEESFSSIDPKTLSPELQAVYKSLQADYTKGKQSIADVRKKADAYDAVSKDQRFVEYWNGLNRTQKADFKEQKAEVEKTLGQKIDDDRFKKAFETKDGFLDLMAEVAKEALSKDRKEIETLKQYKAVNEASGLVEQFATEKGKDGNPVRPDFYSLDEDQLITGFLNVNKPENSSPEAYRARLGEAYGWAKHISQKYYEKGKAEALQVLQKKAATSTEPPTQSAKGAYTGPDPKKMTARDAMELAKKGIRVPRDD